MPRTILVVEDDDDLRESLAGFLEDAGFSVATACTGDAALTRIGRGGVALVLLDLNLPGMSGREFVARRAVPLDDGHVAVVIISGEYGVRDTARALGVAGHLAKPIYPATLLAIAAELCPQA
ncbi:MAG TPA: response regulator [Minicystis sp.]|nr:response regulator [Minicystis sp.]